MRGVPSRPDVQLPCGRLRGDLLRSMISIVRANLRAWLADAHPRHDGARILRQTGTLTAARVVCGVVLDRVFLEQPVVVVAKEIGTRLEVTLAARQSRDPDAFERRLRMLSRTLSLPDARRAKLKGDRWTQRKRTSIGVILLHLVKDWTGTIEFVGNPDQMDRRRRQHLVVATPELLAFLRETGLQVKTGDDSWAPAGAPHPGWRIGTPGIVRRKKLEHMFMPEVYGALNRVQRLPWRLNSKLANQLQTCFEKGWGTAVLPGGDRPTFRRTDKRTWAQFQNMLFRWVSARRRAGVHVHQVRSLPARIHWRWRIDFRGRAYPAGKHISPHGADLGRSMIEFADGVVIGESFRFLARHGANMWGLSRSSHAEREAWVEANTDSILRSAREPLECRWWEGAGDPWRFLAFCHEWAGFVREGADHVTHLPCQVDGTCNGFQIVALLMRDETLGGLVNVLDSTRPHDLYSDVAHDVTEACMRDTGWGRAWLRLLGGAVTRSAVKPACITYAFGASFFSATKATQGWFWSQAFDYPFGGKVTQPCAWLTKQIREALDVRVTSFRRLSAWFHEVAEVVEDLRWTSPVGVPVDNNYVKQRTYKIRDRYRGVEETSERDPARCKRTLMPNFIHSLDAAAMIRTVNACDFDVAPVHDCFSALAPNVPELHASIRRAYAELFAQDQLGRWAEQLGVGSSGLALGSLDPNHILESTYCFT